MKNISFVRHILPHVIAVIAFLLVTVIFFNPVFFENKVISQEDIRMWEGSSKALRDYRAATGEEGLWAPSMFSGMPAYLVNVVWSNGPVKACKVILSLFLPHPVRNIFLAFICYYIMLLCFKVRPYLAIAGAFAFGLSSFVIIGLSAGHNSRIGAMAFMPLVMAGIHLAFSQKRLLGLGLTTMGLALHLNENHLQVTYYILIIVMVYGLIKLIDAIREKQLASFAKTLGMLIPAALIAVGTFVGPLWGITEYTKYSMRGPSELAEPGTPGAASGLSKGYAFEFSNGITEPFTLLIPNIYGGSSSEFLVQDRDSEVFKALSQAGDEQTAQQLMRYTSAYWGNQRLSAPYYAGAIICFLFVIGILYADKRYVWWLVPLSILSIMLSWGDNFAAFNYFLFDHLPGYNKFRSVTFALTIVLFTLPLLGMLGLERMMQLGWQKKTLTKLGIAFGCTAGLCLVFIIIGGGVGDFLKRTDEGLPVWFINALRHDRISLLRGDAWRSFWFITLFAVALWATLKQWVPPVVFALIGAVLILLDLGFVDTRYFSKDNYKRKQTRMTFAPNGADQAILKDPDYYRVYNLQGPFIEARTSYFHNSLGGYHGAKMRRYQDLVDSCLSTETQQLINDAQTGGLSFYDYGVMNMLNTRYITYGEQANTVIRNPAANGPAWFVEDVIKVNSPKEELAKVCDLNTHTTAVVDVSKMELPDTGADSTATITLAEHLPSYMKYESQSNTQALAVFSEIYYPIGWHAFIDGQEVPILRADYVLRALPIPAGKHTVEFRFHPEAYYTGNTITAVCSWLALLLVLGSIGWTVKEENT